jgi:hypothetical protein
MDERRTATNGLAFVERRGGGLVVAASLRISSLMIEVCIIEGWVFDIAADPAVLGGLLGVFVTFVAGVWRLCSGLLRKRSEVFFWWEVVGERSSSVKFDPNHLIRCW